MKKYLIYTICPECDNMVFYSKDVSLIEISNVCNRCGNDNLQLITDDDIVIHTED